MTRQVPHSPQGYPPPPQYGNPGHYMPGGAFNMYPESAFSDSSGDKPTKEIAEYNIYEAWRDVILFTSLDIAVMGTAWWLQMTGFTSGYYTLLWFLRMSNIVVFIWIIGHFFRTPEWMRIRGYNRHRIMGRLLLFLLGGIISHSLFYVFWSR